MTSLSRTVPGTTNLTACLWDDPHDISRIQDEDLTAMKLVYADYRLDQLPPSYELAARTTGANEVTYTALLPAQASYLHTTLVDIGWNTGDAIAFFAHMGRRLIHASKGRDFASASWRIICGRCRLLTKDEKIPTKQPKCDNEKCGTTQPRMYPIQRLGDKQYIRATTPNRAAFLTIDVDLPGRPGGSINDIHPRVLNHLNQMTRHGFAPNLGGVNPRTGKAQFIWFIDPVYSDLDPTKPNRPTHFLQSLHQHMNTLLGGDTAFSHAFMRNPFYNGSDTNAYKWNAWHSSIYQMKHLSLEVRRLNGTSSTPDTKTVKTGRDLILQAKANRERAQQWAQYAQEVGLTADALEANDPDLIQGVRLRYAENGNHIARDETAFAHALKTAIRLRRNGQRLLDDTIIDAYLYAYQVAQEQTKDGRRPEIPSMRDLKTLARRVRGYATKTSQHAAPTSVAPDSHRVTPQERSVLRTFGQRGAKVSNQRRWKDPHSELAQRSLAPLHEANQRRTYNTDENKGRILAYIAAARRDGHEPTTKEIAQELNLSVRRVQQLRKTLGMTAKPGRPPRPR